MRMKLHSEMKRVDQKFQTCANNFKKIERNITFIALLRNVLWTPTINIYNLFERYILPKTKLE